MQPCSDRYDQVGSKASMVWTLSLAFLHFGVCSSWDIESGSIGTSIVTDTFDTIQARELGRLNDNLAQDFSLDRVRALAPEEAAQCKIYRNDAHGAPPDENTQRLFQLAEMHSEGCYTYNKRASAIALQMHNTDKDRDINYLDLHNQRPGEAAYHLRIRIDLLQKQEKTPLSVITGKGRHSHDGIPRVKLKVQELCE